MAAFTGSLSANEIYSAIYNMIISQQVFADNVDSKEFASVVEKAKVDGSLFGDTKLYYSTDALKSIDWTQDSSTALNLLTTHRAPAPACQAIKINKFRQIALTQDDYMTKRAWANEGAFAQFNAVLQAWLKDTKQIYDETTYNAFIGTDKSSTGRQTQNLVLGASLTAEQRAKKIAEKIANVIDDMADVSKNYNDNGFIRKFAPSKIKVIWNAEFVNELRKVDLPAIFHNDGLVEHLTDDRLPARYFGTIITNTNKDDYADNTPAAGKPLDKDGNYAYTPGSNNANGCVRTMKEVDVTVGGTDYHLFAGDEIPANTKLATTSAAGTLLFGEVYIEAGAGANNNDVICKLVVEYPPYMSGFEVGTSFYNARNLSTNSYLTFGHNTLEHLKNYPIVTITTSAS